MADMTSTIAAGVALSMAAALLAGCQSTVATGPDFVPVAATQSGPDFKAVAGPATMASANAQIGAGDILTVTVFQVPDLSSQSAIVSNDGTIALPLVGVVRAAGLTPDQVTSQIRSKLTRYVQSPQVSVSVSKSVSDVYTVEGEVNQPGTFPVAGGRSLLEAVASAGGFNQVADRSDVTIYRVRGGQRQATKFDVDAIRTGTVQDPLVLTGDIIEVGASPVRSALQTLMPATPVAGLGAQVGTRVAK